MEKGEILREPRRKHVVHPTSVSSLTVVDAATHMLYYPARLFQMERQEASLAFFVLFAYCPIRDVHAITKMAGPRLGFLHPGWCGRRWVPLRALDQPHGRSAAGSSIT